MLKYFMNPKSLLLFIFSLFFIPSCAPTKAIIDTTAMNAIIWPGPPEKPRITYQWSMSIVHGKEGLDIAEMLIGGREDFSDPRTSNRLLRPFNLFVDENERLYIVDPGAYRLTIVNLKSKDAMNIISAENEEFHSPVGVVAYKGRIYLSDSLLKKVFIFDERGKKIGEFEGRFERPTGLAINRSKGVIYVADTLAHRIQLFDLNGRHINGFGVNGDGDGEFNFPTHLWVDNSGNLYVTDSMNFRIQIFDSNETFVGKFGTLGDWFGDLDKPKGVATDSLGNIYVVDSVKDMVKIFNREGKILLFFGENGIHYGEFWLPSGIFIDNKDNIYVADTFNGRIQVFKFIGHER
jgi:DNA-binding beta-propeller fold protein YncE